MARLVKIFLVVMLVTTSEGGINTIFPPYLEWLGLAVSRIGLVVSLFGIMSLVARLPAGALYSGLRAKKLLATTLILLAISTGGFAYEGGQIYIIALTLLHGFAFGTVTTILLALAIELNPEGRSHGATMGLYTASISAGYAIGSSLGGFLADVLGFQLGFAIVGGFPLLAAFLSLWLPRPVSKVRSVIPSSKALEEPSPSSTRPRFLRRIDLSGLTPPILLATLVAFYINFLDDAVGTFFPLFGLSIGLNLTVIGGLRSAKSLAATGIRPVSGFFFRFVDYRLLNNAAILIWSLVVLLFPGMRVAWLFLIAFILSGLCRGLIRVTSATMVAEEKSRHGSGLGLASGIYNAGLDLGGFAGPIAGGVLASAIGIPGMFRVVPAGLFAAYVVATVLVSRLERRTAVAGMVGDL